MTFIRDSRLAEWCRRNSSLTLLKRRQPVGAAFLGESLVAIFAKENQAQ
jgi:hypothetical protein